MRASADYAIKQLISHRVPYVVTQTRRDNSIDIYHRNSSIYPVRGAQEISYVLTREMRNEVRIKPSSYVFSNIII